VPHEAAIASRSARETSVEKLAQFFPDAIAVRIPVRVTGLGARGSAAAGKALEESTVIEWGTAREVLFASELPLEFDDQVRLENSDGTLKIVARVVAVQYHNGRTAVAARFTHPISNWIIQR
jgi:hypothetical protein